jgi:hypothetical protein
MGSTGAQEGPGRWRGEDDGKRWVLGVPIRSDAATAEAAAEGALAALVNALLERSRLRPASIEQKAEASVPSEAPAGPRKKRP